MSGVVFGKAPGRIYFSGGGTDLSPYDSDRGGAVVSTTIARYARAWVEPSEVFSISSADFTTTVEAATVDGLVYDGSYDLIKAVLHVLEPPEPVAVSVASDIPPQSGVGGSAALAVAVIGAVSKVIGRDLSPRHIAELAYRAEREELRNICGRQDQYGSAFGRCNLMLFRGGADVEVVPVHAGETIAKVEAGLLLVDIGPRRRSGEILQDHQDSFTRKIHLLDALKQSALDAYSALCDGNIARLGQVVNRAFELKKKLIPELTNEFIESIHRTALDAGALAARINGPGGGGHMFVLCVPESRDAVKQALEQLSVSAESLTLARAGLQVRKGPRARHGRTGNLRKAQRLAANHE